MGNMFVIILVGVVILSAVFIGLFFRKKNTEEKRKSGHWITSWGFIIIGIFSTLIQIAIYFLDKTQFSLSQLMVGVVFIAVGIFYFYKYKKQPSQSNNI